MSKKAPKPKRKANVPTQWKTIPDNQVRHIWVNPDGTDEIAVDPSFYAAAGTPVYAADGFDGVDMIYVRTEILA